MMEADWQRSSSLRAPGPGRRRRVWRGLGGVRHPRAACRRRLPTLSASKRTRRRVPRRRNSMLPLSRCGISEGREMFSMSAASCVVRSACTGIRVTALLRAIASRMGRSIRTVEAGSFTVPAEGSSSKRSCRGSVDWVRTARTRLVSLARIRSQRKRMPNPTPKGERRRRAGISFERMVSQLTGPSRLGTPPWWIGSRSCYSELPNTFFGVQANRLNTWSSRGAPPRLPGPQIPGPCGLSSGSVRADCQWGGGGP